MALDDQVRKNADALAKELGLDIQQAFGRFLDDVLAQVTKDQGALQAQSDQAVAAAKARAEAAEAAVAEAQGAVAQAQADGEARKTQAVTAVKEESAAALQAAISQTRENVAREAAGLVARAREEAAQANAALQADRESRKGLDEEAAALRASAERAESARMIARRFLVRPKIFLPLTLSCTKSVSEPSAVEAPRNVVSKRYPSVGRLVWCGDMRPSVLPNNIKRLWPNVSAILKSSRVRSAKLLATHVPTG